jgi:hypothetical protein
VKFYVRKMCDYSLAGLNKNVPKALELANSELALIRRYANKSARFMSAYRYGATGTLAHYAATKYRGHRCLPESWFMDTKGEYKETFKEDATLRSEIGPEDKVPAPVPHPHLNPLTLGRNVV